MDYTSNIRQRKQPLRLREIEVLIISAQDLKNVKHVTKMRPYAVVYVQKDHVAKTHVVKVRFHEGLPESDVMAMLNVDIYAQGHIQEKLVGSARVLLASLEALWEAPGATQLVDPPTGRFLIRRESLSFSIEEAPEEVEKKVKESMEVEM
ncbi:hypothetical protein I3842_10G092200 [Carya illinoinensis]|uniref:C2 domain-containing protein n=1 Tax=Carya illinoinensis TaxID=32201 RepID=A0A922DWH2_CARIL|nr:hypothetical protein I3842_10G092200 [Carya illinoinensis]